MATHYAPTVQQPIQPTARRSDWVNDSILSGFVATIVMSVGIEIAFWICRALGQEDGNFFEKWLWALTNNPVAETTQDRIAIAIALNVFTGLVWALVYGYIFEPRLSGPGWRKGMIFSLIPWVLSIVAFLPILGGGFLGLDIDAGPLPIVGNLILHLIYGAVLGWMYTIDFEEWLDGTDADRANAEAAERGAIAGGIIGLVLGGLVGLAAAPKLDDLGSTWTIGLVSALVGAGFCALLGSFYGMERVKTEEREAP
jgi:Family of unknown function (DUF6789)